MNKNIIKKVELDLDGMTITLTVQQAKNLKSALKELFGEQEIKKEYIPYPYPVYPYRQYWEWRIEPYYYTTTSGISCNYNANDTLKINL